MARRSRNMPAIGCRTPSLAAFAKAFLRELGPGEDIADAADILGQIGRRSKDRALRRRMISARIALLSQDGTNADKVMPKDTAEEPKVLVVEEWPSAMPSPNPKPAPAGPKPTPKFQLTPLEEATKVLLNFDDTDPESESKVARTAAEAPAAEAVQPPQQDAEPVEVEAEPETPQPTTTQSEPSVRYAQETSKVMNAAKPPEANPAVAPKKKKKRQTASGPIDFSALADLGGGSADQTGAEPPETPTTIDAPPDTAQPEDPEIRKDGKAG